MRSGNASPQLPRASAPVEHKDAAAAAENDEADRSVAEAARILQIPPGTVKSCTFEGLRALRRALAAHDAVA